MARVMGKEVAVNGEKPILVGDKKNKTARNSNIEALRIFAMFLIMLIHFPWDKAAILHGAGPVKYRILGIALSFLTNWGGVGDDLFFLISCWFICDEKQSIKNNLHRAWVLEFQLLFIHI